MTGHLLVPAIDGQWPATLSRRVLNGLLREELGFQGVVITDGIEMRAVADRYGLEAVAVRALASGVDAICVGGDHADEETARRLRDAIVAAVVNGELPEERLVEAAKRVGQLAAWTAAARADLPAGAGSGPDGSVIGLAAARRAVRLTATADAVALPLAGPVHVVEFAPPRNIAIGAETPWGLAEPLAALLSGTTSVRLTAEDLPTGDRLPSSLLAPAVGRPLVLVVRDLHRHDWMAATVARVLAVRPDTVVVELGVPELVTGRLHLSTYGATRAGARAAAELLAGRS